MKWFQDKKTMTKLLMSFGVTTAIMLLVGGLGLSGMNQINGMLKTLYERDMIGASNLQRAESDAVRIGRWVRQVLIAPDAAGMQAAKDQMEAQDVSFREHIEAADKCIILADNKARLAEVRTVYNAYITKARDVAKIAMGGEREKAIDTLNKELKPIMLKLDGLLGELVTSKIALGKRAFEESDTVYQRAKNISSATMVVALALGVLFAFVVGKSISTPLSQAVGVLEKVADGDFTERLELDTKDEAGQLAGALNTAVERMRQALDEVRGVANDVASASTQLSSSSSDIAGGAQKQAASLEETAASLEEITSTVKQNADNAQHASQLASGSRDIAEKGGRVVESAVLAMGEITTASKKIAEIITAIDEIAFQTNLLALNAAVEAARAGEQGRGFAVVATEVRNLAQRSATAAKEIKGLIVDSVDKIETGSKHVTESGHTLQEIVSSVKRVTDMVSEIAAASREQNTGIDQVNKAVTQMDQVTQQNASQTEELSATAESLTRQAESLQALVRRFRLDSDESSFGARPKASAASVRRIAPKPAQSGKRLVATAKRHASSDAAPRAATGTDGFDEF